MRLRVAICLCLAAPAASAQEEETSRQEEFREYLAPGYRELLTGRGRISDRLQVGGSAKTEIGYDDNVLLDDDNRESDIITSVVPTLVALYDHDRFVASAQYRGPYRRFADHDEFDGMEHFAEGHLRYTGERVHAHLWDSWQHLREPYDAVIFRDRLKRRQNDAGATVGVTFNRVEAEVGASYRLFNVLDDVADFYDNSRLDATLLAGWRFTEKASAILEVGQGRIRFDDSTAFNDFDLTWVVAGVRGSLTEKLFVEFKAGPFRSDVRTDDAAVPSDDETDVLVKSRLVWHLSQPQILTVEFERIPVETLTQGWALYTRLRVGYDHWLAERVQVGVVAYYDLAEDPEGGPDSRGIGIIGTARYEFGRNFVIDAKVEVRRLDADGGDATSNVRGYAGIAVVW